MVAVKAWRRAESFLRWAGAGYFYETHRAILGSLLSCAGIPHEVCSRVKLNVFFRLLSTAEGHSCSRLCKVGGKLPRKPWAQPVGPAGGQSPSLGGRAGPLEPPCPGQAGSHGRAGSEPWWGRAAAPGSDGAAEQRRRNNKSLATPWPCAAAKDTFTATAIPGAQEAPGLQLRWWLLTLRTSMQCPVASSRWGIQHTMKMVLICALV